MKTRLRELPRGQREPGRGITQPSLHLLAEYCTTVGHPDQSWNDYWFHAVITEGLIAAVAVNFHLGPTDERTRRTRAINACVTSNYGARAESCVAKSFRDAYAYGKGYSHWRRNLPNFKQLSVRQFDP